MKNLIIIALFLSAFLVAGQAKPITAKDPVNANALIDSDLKKSLQAEKDKQLPKIKEKWQKGKLWVRTQKNKQSPKFKAKVEKSKVWIRAQKDKQLPKVKEKWQRGKEKAKALKDKLKQKLEQRQRSRPTSKAKTLQSGQASFYGGPFFEGRKTASGEKFRNKRFTAAHRRLPLGSIVRVWSDGKYVDVVINDRGPYVGSRVIDLTPRAFKR